MKIKTTFLLSALTLGAVAAQAQTAAPAAPKAPEPDYTLAYNIGAVSDYRYRGISQTRLKPAVQGGADFAHKDGFYMGAWATNIKWIKDNSSTGYPVEGPIELDIYGGYKFAAGPLAMDVGALRYQYVGNGLRSTRVNGVGGVYGNANTNEVYAAASYSVATFKYSQSLGNLFGNLNSKASQYFDLSANFDLGSGFTLTPHVGRQIVNKSPSLSYTDYSVTLAKDLGKGYSLSAMAVSTNAKPAGYTWGGKEVGKSGAVLGVKYTF
jgi:uncharacterized protein (TIGR02001 family)